MKNILEINNVTKFYKNSVKALENVNLNIKEGEIFLKDMMENDTMLNNGKS